MSNKLTEFQRLKKVLQRLDTSGQCWLYTGSKNGDGYGTVRIGKLSKVVHKFIYERFEKPVPEGWHLHHLCNNKACAAPWHLEPVTPEVHCMERSNTIFRKKKATTHCPKGHEYNEKNTYTWQGMRRCRECNRLLNEQRRLQKVEEHLPLAA